MGQRFDAVQQYYDVFSTIYDDVTLGKNRAASPIELNNYLSPILKPGMNVLDVGAGTGQTLQLAVERGCNVCALDMSEKMLQIVRSKFPKVETHQANLAEDLPLAIDRKFDVITAISMLEFLPNMEKILKKLSDRLAPKGHLCFTFEEYLPDHPLQNQKVSTAGPGTLKIEAKKQITNYRFELNEILAMLKKLELSVLHHKKFLAYLKSDALIPVYYQIVLVQKNA